MSAQNAQDPHELWARCLLRIERHVEPRIFTTWFRSTKIRRFDAETLVIEVESSFIADWLEGRYLDLIQQVVLEETDTQPRITFIVGKDTPRSIGSSEQTESSARFPQPTENQVRESEAADLQQPFTPLLNRYTFNNFVIGESNRLAHAAAQAVAQSPGKSQQFNPLVIYGGVGLGKTHLLQAIGNSAHGHSKVVYVSSERFMSEFIESLAEGNTQTFKERYRNTDILLVDDIQFFIRGEKTQDEFFHTFNTLYQNGKQIVMTCDSHPGKWEGLEERLTSRFQWGLVINIDPPDLETRIAILHRKAQVHGIPLPNNVAAFLGTYVSSNIRELEGALIHLMAHCSINQTDLTVEAARQIVQERVLSPQSELRVETIQQQVAEHFNLTKNQLNSRTRKQEVAGARQIAMFLSKRLAQQPLKAIGHIFGGRDHTTVIHAVKTVEKKMEQDPSFARMVETLSESIQQKSAPI
ncbi:MAG: chromosomal replication initiator protein DnaA [Candidatus Latescibacteria bacterium]|nr:chromosomal replication initiator protein DnaA [Candidatus Latescibacterota bacterium]